MNWITKIPPFDTQYSADTHTDAQDCVEESFVHIVYMLTGKLYSARALGYLTKVTPNGSSVTECLAAVAKYGLIPYDLWPTPASFTWESYYSDIPQSVLDQADHYDVQLIDPDLNKSPLWTELSFPDGPGNNFLHLVAQITPTQYFDSEPGGAVKPLNYRNATIQNFRTSIKLIPKNMAEFVHVFGTDTYGLEYTTEFVSTIVKFSSQSDAKEKLKNIPGALNADGSVKFESAKEIRL